MISKTGRQGAGARSISLPRAGPVLGRLDQIGPRTLRGPALAGVPFCTVRYKIGESAKSFLVYLGLFDGVPNSKEYNSKVLRCGIIFKILL